jgi:hypothetical protein
MTNHQLDLLAATNLLNNNDTKEFVIKAENDSEEKMKRKIGLIINAVKAKQK